jgi:hypothetical protein
MLFGEDWEMAMMILLVAGVLLVLGAFGTTLAGLAAWFLKAGRDPFELEVSSLGIAFVENDGLHWLEWKRFSRWFETNNLLVLVACAPLKNETLAIPKRSCAATDWPTVIDFVRSGMGEPARW